MRIKRLRKIMKEKKMDLALFYNLDSDGFDKNMYYFSGYAGIGCLVVPLKKSPFMVVPVMEQERAEKTGRVKSYKWEKGKGLFEKISGILSEKKIKARDIGIIYSEFRLDVFKSMKKFLKKTKLKDMGKECFEIRAVKTEDEIKLLKKSCKITSEIINKCISNFDKFRTEKDVDIFLRTETVKNGCELAFPPIVASGKSGSMPHYEPKNIKLRKGFCVIDFGVKYNGYCSDITRTVYLGEPSEKEKEAYDILLSTQERVIKDLKPGKKCFISYEETIVLLGRYKDNFNHGLGHGVGLNIHELPNLKLVSEDKFSNNMVFTVEPGIYIENEFGIRIEDTVLLQNGKPIILTNVTKKLVKIER